MIIMHGIKNCDTVKKAKKWLDDNACQYQFRDYKKDPAGEGEILKWIEKSTVDVVLNKRGTTWRKLADEDKNSVVDDKSAAKLMAQNNSMIKRPIIEIGEKTLVGFDAENYAENLK